MKATAYMGYNYALDKWCMMGINLVEHALPPASYISRGLNNKGSYLWPSFVDAPIESVSWDGEHYNCVVSDSFEFPEVVTLEQSIANNRKLLSSY